MSDYDRNAIGEPLQLHQSQQVVAETIASLPQGSALHVAGVVGSGRMTAVLAGVAEFRRANPGHSVLIVTSRLNGEQARTRLETFGVHSVLFTSRSDLRRWLATRASWPEVAVLTPAMLHADVFSALRGVEFALVVLEDLLSLAPSVARVLVTRGRRTVVIRPPEAQALELATDLRVRTLGISREGQSGLVQMPALHREIRSYDLSDQEQSLIDRSIQLLHRLGRLPGGETAAIASSRASLQTALLAARFSQQDLTGEETLSAPVVPMAITAPRGAF
jgi:hypothetical protein